MKDSILKGTGNSRFLKSAVSAGTSWADALAMLQAGTFPIDFNGINAEGFQQVGTPLNKANLLKDATAAQIGLPPSTTPDGMFQALGNTGELHVWKKTITSGTGTTTTYLVSTNPNAYQEGSDAKEAGYTLGEVVTGKVLASKCYNNTAIYYGKSVSVSDDGIVSILNPTTRTLSSTLSSAEIAAIKDSFVYFSGNENYSDVSSAFRYGNIVYIPADASVSTEYANSAYGVYIDRYQPVTGYAAIPAGTTIEYLGKLGDKTRVQVVSYVGTGTYGKSNQNSLTFDFVPKVVMIRCGGDTKIFDAIYGMRDVTVVLSAGYYVIVEWSKKTLSWYSTNSASEQMNYAGYKYYAIAIG